MSVVCAELSSLIISVPGMSSTSLWLVAILKSFVAIYLPCLDPFQHEGAASLLTLYAPSMLGNVALHGSWMSSFPRMMHHSASSAHVV